MLTRENFTEEHIRQLQHSKSLYLNLSCDVATDTYRIIEQHKNSI